jgi:hypothetical protein
VYEEEGDYFVGRLNRMWVQEQPLASIKVVDGDRWGTFQGNYFIKIEIADLLQYQRSVRHPENDASSIGVTDAASSLLCFTSGSSIGGSHVGNGLRRVLETPPE